MDEESSLIEELDLSFHPLTQKLWRDFELLFGRNGACGGCWCMYWKLRGKAFSENTGDVARQMQKSIVDAKTVPGLLAYSEGYPVGWIAVEPRSAYPKLAHSRVLKPVDDQPVWSITCFFVEKKHRRKGITVELLKAAVEYVKKQGGKIVEGYPVDAQESSRCLCFTGTASAFRKAGFVEVARNSPTRPIFRYYNHENQFTNHQLSTHFQPPSKSLTPRDYQFIALVVIVFLAICAALIYANLTLKGGGEFYVHWVGARAFLFDKIDPYSGEVAARVQELVYDGAAKAGDEPYILDTPFQILLLYFPFSLFSNPTVVRAVFTLLLELALFALAVLSLRLTEWESPRFFAIFFIFLAVFNFYAFQAVFEASPILILAFFYAAILTAYRAEADEFVGAWRRFPFITGRSARHFCSCSFGAPTIINARASSRAF